MKLLVYSSRNYIKPYLIKANNGKHNITFIEEALTSKTAMKAVGYDAISIFSGDEACILTIEKLKSFGVKYILLRSVGYDNVNIRAASRCGIKVANVPAYSPYAIAEHAVGLLLALNRKLIDSNDRIRHFNFDINDLIGEDLNGKTVGIVGTGKIGSVFTKIMSGFGCKLLGFDIEESQELIDKYNLQYVSLETLCEQSNIISLHIPLNSETHYLIDETLISKMKPGVTIINTSRGAVVNTSDIIDGLRNQIIGSYGMDVYENEKQLFFEDHSIEVPTDDMFVRLNSMPNVLITGHHAFLTKEALTNIADATITNMTAFEQGRELENELTKSPEFA